jgi:hypothetical protein
MLSLFKQHQEALLAAQEAATDADDLASKKMELDALFAAEKKKLKKAEKQEKAKAKQEAVNAGLAKQTKAAKVEEFQLLNKKYVKHSRWYDFQRARSAIWEATGGEPFNYTPRGGRIGSSHHRSHHVTTSGLCYKISAKTRTSAAILWVAEDNEEEGPVDALEGELSLSELNVSETAAKLAQSTAMKTFLASYLSKTPEQVIEADDDARAEYYKILISGKEPSLAAMKEALQEAGEAGVEAATRPSRKGTAKLLLDILKAEQDATEDSADEAEGVEREE